jgi:DNA-directed RNA polymerase specialized sigma24 family protein
MLRQERELPPPPGRRARPEPEVPGVHRFQGEFQPLPALNCNKDHRRVFPVRAHLRRRYEGVCVSEANHAFASQEPLLWRVLGVLARHGYPAPPDEGRDIVHDFYVEAWEGLQQRFEPAKSQFSTYVSAAFYQFARRRIVGLQAWRRRLVDAELLIDHASEEPSPADVLQSSQDVLRVQAALARLPAAQRALLHDYVLNPGGGERALAERHRLSRHALRMALADAVGRVAVEMGRLPAPDTPERRIVSALWREGRSPKAAAAHLGVPLERVHDARTRFSAELLAAIRRFDASASVHPGRADVNPDIQILRAALLAPDDAVALAAVQRAAPAIREALGEHEDVLSDAEFAALAERGDWIGRVYAALGTSEDEGADERAIEHALRRLRQDEAHEIGEAFAALLEGLGPVYRDWQRWFDRSTVVDDRAFELIADDASLEAGRRHAIELARYGVTPLAVHGSTRGLQLLFDRTRRALRDGRPGEAGLQAPHGGVGLALADAAAPACQVPLTLIDAQVASTRNLPAASVQPLRRWLFDVLVERPYLVNRYVFDAERVCFAPAPAAAPELERELLWRWCRPAPGVAQPRYSTAFS